MKKVIIICLAVLLVFASVVGVIIKNTTITKSPDKSYSIVGICIDIGGAGYIGNYYFVNNKNTVPRIYNTGCNTPGRVTWQSDNEFSINNRNGVCDFIITNNGLIARE